MEKNVTFLGWSILFRMSFAWDSRAARLEGFFSGKIPSFAFFPFFLPPSFILGSFGGLGTLGILGGLGGFVAFFLAGLSRGGEEMCAGDVGSSGSDRADGGSSAGGFELLGSLFMAFVAFWDKNTVERLSTITDSDNNWLNMYKNILHNKNQDHIWINESKDIQQKSLTTLQCLTSEIRISLARSLMSCAGFMFSGSSSSCSKRAFGKRQKTRVMVNLHHWNYRISKMSNRISTCFLVHDLNAPLTILAPCTK